MPTNLDQAKKIVNYPLFSLPLFCFCMSAFASVPPLADAQPAGPTPHPSTQQIPTSPDNLESDFTSHAWQHFKNGK